MKHLKSYESLENIEIPIIIKKYIVMQDRKFNKYWDPEYAMSYLLEVRNITINFIDIMEEN